MIFITIDTWQKMVEVVVSNETKWLNEKHIETKLGHSNLAVITLKYPEDLRKERHELQKCDGQPCRKFIREDFAIQTMDCRAVAAVAFRSKLGFKQHDPIMTQEQSILKNIDTYFKTEDKLFQPSVLGYRIDLYAPKYKLAIEVDGLGHCTRDIKSEIERQSRIKRELGCKFIRIDPSRENVNVIDEFSRIKDYIVESTNKLTKKATKKIQ